MAHNPFYLLDGTNLQLIEEHMKNVDKYKIGSSYSIFDRKRMGNIYTGNKSKRKNKKRRRQLRQLKLNRTKQYAKVLDDIVTLDLADPKQAAKARLVAPEKSATDKVKRKVSDIKKKAVTKKNSFGKWFREEPRIKNGVKALKAKLGTKGGLLVGAVTVAGMFMASRAVNGGVIGRKKMGVSTRPTLFNNRASYLPGSYKRGFNEIKERLTDFGSKVHLDKTTSKVMISPINSTRNGTVTSTQSIMNSNLALAMSKNAINHTRY